MGFLESLPILGIAALIFLSRIVDVSLGTMRTISVVNARIRLSVMLGFFEILVWVTAVSQVIARIDEHPALTVAYAAGFAAGNALGITLERKLAIGVVVVRMISEHKGDEIAERLRGLGQIVTVFRGEGRDGPRTLLYAACARRRLPRLMQEAKGVDPSLFCVVERFAQTSDWLPLPSPSGWRAVLKKK